MKAKYTEVGNVIIVGTSHIAEESVKNVARVVEQFRPCIVGVELDKHRFAALVQRQRMKYPPLKSIRQFGIKGYVFAFIASYVSRKLAKMAEAEPGDDMMSAILTAQKHNLLIALLDQPIHTTLRRFSRYLTWREKWNFVVDGFRGFFFPQKEMQKYGLDKLDLKKVPAEDVVKGMLSHVKKRYPNIYRVLIDERNKYMVRQIKKFQKKYPDEKIVAVVGAGHEEGMVDLLQKKK